MDPALHRYFSIPGYAWLWLAFAVAGGLFAYRVSVLIRILRLGKGENRFTDIGSRIRRVLVDVLLQPRLKGDIMWPVHLAIFWGFVVYALSFWFTLFKGLAPILPYPWPDEIGVVKLLLEIWAALVLIALGVAAYRRYLVRPVGLKLSGDATFILVLIASLMVTTLLGSAFKHVSEPEASAAWSPLGAPIGSLFHGSGLAPGTAGSLALAMWWSHILLVLFFLAYLPFSKHLHLLAAPFSVLLTDLGAKGRLSPEAPPEEAAAAKGAPAAAAAGSEGATFDLRSFTWRELLTPLACAECGRCDRYCPAFTSGAALSPQKLVHHLKEHMLEAGPTLLAARNGNGAARPLLEGIVSVEELRSCVTCFSCMEHCAVRNEHLPLLVRMRRHLVGDGKVETPVQDVLTALGRYGNSFGQSERARAKWTQGLPFKIKDARKEPVTYLWFVGDYASYDPRLQEGTRSLAKVFHGVDLDFGIMYEAERNSGNDIRRVGEEGLFEMLAEKNIAALSKCQFKEIVTTDPHSYNTLKNEYPDLGAKHTVLHYTELLDRLIREGRFVPAKKLGARVTYQDPCYLGRYNGVYEEPRRVLEALGADLVEMPRHGRDGWCCGAGGGGIWRGETPGVKERPAESRIREAVELGGIGTIVTTCPKDLVMLQDAAKTTGNEKKIAVKDLSDLVLAAVA